MKILLRYSFLLRLSLLVAFFLWSVSVRSQTGPGGVGNSSTNKVWLDASYQIPYSNGATQVLILDRSGNGWDAQQFSGGAYRPTFLNNALNGRPVIHFDRTSATQYLEITNPGIGVVMSNSNTIFAVAKTTSGGKDATTNYSQYIISANHSNGFTGIRYLAAQGSMVTSMLGYDQALSNGTNLTTYYNDAVTQNKWYIASKVSQSAGTTTSINSYANGLGVGTNSSTFGMQSNSDLVRIGTRLPSGSWSCPFNGDIAEIIIYNTALNNAQRTIIDNYLSAKYNLPVSNDYYTANDAAYILDVQGIGTTDGSITQKHSLAANSKGLVLTELNNSLDVANEFLLSGHNSAVNSFVTAEVTAPFQQRWQRVWYVEKTGIMDAKLSFDFSDAGFPAGVDLANNLAHYQLLFRSGTSGPFTVLALPPTLENGDQLAFSFLQNSLNSGYYTLGLAAIALATPTISLSGPASFCQGSSVTLSVPSVAGSSYQWLLNEAIIPGATNNTYQATQTGTYRVTVTKNGAFATSPIVSVLANPVPTVTVSPSVTIHSGESTTLTANGSAVGSALTFDGKNDYVQIGDQAGLKATNLLTVEAWIYPTGPGSGVNNGGGIIVNREGEYEIARFSDGTIQWAFANTTPGWQFINTGMVAPLNTWSHIAITYQSGTVKAYLNGTLKQTYTGSGNIGDALTVTNDFRIGGRQWGGQSFQGSMDEIRVWNTVRSQTQVASSLYTTLPANTAGLIGYWQMDEGSGTTVVDASSNGYAGTMINGTTWLSPSTSPIAPTFTWSPATGLNTTTGAGVTASPAVTTTYTVTATSGSGCSRTAQVTVTVLTQVVWTGSLSSDWNTGGNWLSGQVPTATSEVVVNTCPDHCPQLNSSVSVTGLQLNNGSTLAIGNYTLSVAGAVSMNETSVLSSQGMLQALDFTEVKNSHFQGAITLEKTGGSSNSWYGGNTFSHKVKFINASTSDWQVSTTADNLIQSP